VTAVDESGAMLAHVRGAETVRARIEALELGRRFACVLLMSQLVNVPDHAERHALLSTCGRHVAEDGVVLIERHEPDWQPVEGRGRERGGFAFSLEDVRKEGRTVAATVRYEADGRTWRHPFVAQLLDDEELEHELARAGLRLIRVLGERRTWVEARLYSAT
jgi:hypothetical protein